MKFARKNGKVAVDVRADSPDGKFTQNIVDEFIPVPDDVEDGWILDAGGWVAPTVAEPVLVTPAKPVDSQFTQAERIAIAMEWSADFALQKMIALDVVLEGVDFLDYLTAKGLIAAGRKDEISAEIVK